jgi:hypothetical protein
MQSYWVRLHEFAMTIEKLVNFHHCSPTKGGAADVAEPMSRNSTKGEKLCIQVTELRIF